ncbi:hypothetical protein HanRHA438_Chr12g0573661 [Helianthus annuus]|nr:hypothetical protein HanHA300_Chr12g0461331 [Helianthus annuus]KAJ0506845.1 hypothetical protein HanHA89_Chr12g0486731 [Helianthus annuus]KAJ0772196.1 hypothetical protein HanPI659440_Chr07g0277581 [Helianthus annuus]KAJ0868351.1 hypothetical protein HanRHA438_Chr12g0573661 [Helianthus annuus]
MKFKLITIQATRFFISSFTCSPPVCGNVYVNKDTSMLRYRLWVVFGGHHLGVSILSRTITSLWTLS